MHLAFTTGLAREGTLPGETSLGRLGHSKFHLFKVPIRRDRSPQKCQNERKKGKKDKNRREDFWPLRGARGLSLMR